MFAARLPVSLFAVVLGIAGLGHAWQAAARLWGAPGWIGQAILGIAAAAWLLLLAGYAIKWIAARADASLEFCHPVQCCFVGLAPVGGMLVAIALLPYAHGAGLLLLLIAGGGQLAFAVWRTGGLWQGGRDPAATTPVLYLPTVAGALIAAAALAAAGEAGWGRLFFGAGLLSWIAIDSVILHRLYTVQPMEPALRPTLGIQLAPPAVAAVAYLAVTDGPPGIFVEALIGYALMQALVLLRLMPWVWSGHFVPGYWAYSFGVTALALAALGFAERGGTGPIVDLAPVLFALANLAIGLLTIGTLGLLLRGDLIPGSAPAAPRT